MTFPDHLEAHLGLIDGGHPFRSADMPDQRLNAARFVDQPCEGATTFVSLGLSHHRLQDPDTHEDFRQELLVCCWNRWAPAGWALVSVVVEEVLKRHEPLVDGATVGFEGRPLHGISGVLAWPPVRFGEGLALYEGEEPIHVTWLLPLTSGELAFARSRPGDREVLAELLLDRGVDILDLERRSAALPV